ncbi:MAG: TAXI family TRAP transporter solute-binding subunit [Campylobacterales bacterium]
MGKLGKLVGLIVAGVLSWGYQIVTGAPSGTYYRFGEDLKRYVASPVGVNLEVLPSHGSVENLKLMALDPEKRFGIVQQDVIEAVKRSTNPTIRLRGELVKLLLPLYLEEVHLIVRKGAPFQKFEDLKGRKFGIIKNSGSGLTTALLAKYVLGNSVAEMVPVPSLQQGLQFLKEGKIDWILLVCGQPCEKVQNLDPAQFKLLPFDGNRPYLSYQNVEISPASYPNLHLQKPIPTIGVRSLLIIRDSSDTQVASDVRKLAIQLYKVRRLLQQKGHPKWKEVRFQLFPIPGWRYYLPFKEGWEIGKEVSSTEGGEKCTPEKLLIGSCK